MQQVAALARKKHTLLVEFKGKKLMRQATRGHNAKLRSSYKYYVAENPRARRRLPHPYAAARN